MGDAKLMEEKYFDIEEMISDSLSSTKTAEDKEDLVIEYLCQTIAKYDSYDAIKKKALQNDAYAFMQMASWHIAYAKNIRDYCIAFQYAKKARKAGYIEADYILGQLYYYGTGCVKSEFRAFRCFQSFVEQANRKKLLNDNVLADAYLKMAEIEKNRYRFDHAEYYYRKLKNFNADFSKYVDAFEHEMKEKQKDCFGGIILVASSFLILSVAVISFSNYFGRESKSFLNKYQQRVVVTKVDSTMISDDFVPGYGNLKETKYFHDATKQEIIDKKMMKIPVKKIIATSTYLSNQGTLFIPENLLSDDKAVYWQEGKTDNGVGVEISLEFDEDTMISGMMILNGKAISKEEYLKNNRISTLMINGKKELTLPLKDTNEEQYFVFDVPICTSKLTMMIKDVYKGSIYNDTCVTQIAVFE